MRRWGLIGLALALVLAAGLRDGADRWIDATRLPPLAAGTSVEVKDREGTLLHVHTVADGRWRLAVDPGHVDPTYLDMLRAYEDRRFERHSGVDPLALLRAVAQALWHGRVVSGGSTLTMQVARLLERSGTGHWRGKLRQMRVALALERRLSKRQILALYLTHAPFGGNLEGVRAASLAWFGKDPARLTEAEAALLVALPQSPETRRPDRARTAARAARDRVLARMASDGVITPEAALAALSEPVPDARRPFPALAPHLSERARTTAPDTPDHRLTLDAALQSALERLARDRLRDLPPGAGLAVLVADHRTGAIRAWVGSGRYAGGDGRQGFVDMTRALRSPGSTLKPLVYGLAFDRGMAHPQTLIDDSPARFGRYAPQNFDGAFLGEMTVAEALRGSRNVPVIRLLDRIGPAHLMQALRRSGAAPALPGDGPAGLAVALGGVGLSLHDLVQLYAMLAQGGQARPLHWRAGEGQPPGVRVLSRAAAWQVGDILAGLPPPAGAAPGQVAYKTGTSYGHRDAWAVGYDGAHVLGVWIGRPDGTPLPGALGADLAAPLLFEAFARLPGPPVPLPPPPPETLILPTAGLPQPLRRFDDAGGAGDAPEVAFPPDGARLALPGDGLLTLKVARGRPPFTWLANGAPVLTGQRRREVVLDGLGPGFSRLTVIDATGRSAAVGLRIDAPAQR
ncbi:penicillin-binding protein 1C [Roseovarius ramblicola]|uniref:peptidoglycan glycosyltransferase n=1 Tax=Roseovarius ramblicola TaxID=2022336 RepID=A0ABV5I2K3_9RHOB